jgi:DNA-binding response OmpR family regulator
LSENPQVIGPKEGRELGQRFMFYSRVAIWMVPTGHFHEIYIFLCVHRGARKLGVKRGLTIAISSQQAVGCWFWVGTVAYGPGDVFHFWNKKLIFALNRNCGVKILPDLATMADSHAIAVVDDDRNLLEIFGAALSSPHWEVSCLDNAKVAENRISQQRFSALLTDALPGYEDVIAAFKTRNPTSPAVLLTGSLHPELEKRARAAGADLVLYKPIGIAALRENLQNVISAAAQHSRSKKHNPEIERALEAEDRLLKAWRTADVETLEELLGEEYQFATADRAESKSQRLEALRSGRLRYLAVHASDRETKYYSDICVISSMLEISGEREGARFVGRYRSVRIFRKKGGQWKAVAGQLTESAA